MRARGLGGALLVVVVAAGAVAASRACGKTGPSPAEQSVYPSLEGTLCDAIAKAPPARPHGPLPSDPALAAWTEQVESGLEEALALEAVGQAADYGYGAVPTESARACARKLLPVVLGRLPAEHRLRREADDSAGYLLRNDAGTPERMKLAIARDASAPAPSSSASGALGKRFAAARNRETGPGCTNASDYLAAFPDNARLRRALVLDFVPCVEDNYNSFDGPLDRNEIFMRETLESWPERAGLDFELLAASDPTTQNAKARTWMWLRAPFARIPLDLGVTGNALWVVRDLEKKRPGIAKQLLPVARKYVTRDWASNRRARWTALVAYLEADAPDPGEPREPALARALAGNEASARWALGYLPNELQEHAPRPFPYLRDPAVIEATVVRAERVTTDEDRILVLDVLSQMPPGTALAMMARWSGSPNESVWLAAVEAIEKQNGQLPIKAPPGELEAVAERRANAARLLAPHLAVLRTALAPRVCAHPAAIGFLADAGDKEIDAEVLSCVEGKPQPDTDFLTTLFHACLDHPELGWVKTGTALSKTASPGENGYYARRVANGCTTGKD